MIHELLESADKAGHKEAMIITLVVLYVLIALFSLTLFLFLKRLPKEKQVFPAWFVWFFLIPWVGLIFRWMMLPFGIPKAIKATYPKNQDIIEYANGLFKLGLAQVIVTSTSFFIPLGNTQDVIGIVGVMLWIVYWVKILRFQNNFIKG